MSLVIKDTFQLDESQQAHYIAPQFYSTSTVISYLMGTELFFNSLYYHLNVVYSFFTMAEVDNLTINL